MDREHLVVLKQERLPEERLMIELEPLNVVQTVKVKVEVPEVYVKTEQTTSECSVCFAQFPDENAYNEHMKIHWTQCGETDTIKTECDDPLALHTCSLNSGSSVCAGHRGSALQITGDIRTGLDSNQIKDDDENPTTDYEQNPRQIIIGVRLKKMPKTSAECDREFKARKALLEQRQDRAIVKIATDNIPSASRSDDSQVPVPSEIKTVEKRAKSAEATRRWRERKKGVSGSSEKQAKTAAQRMQEYRARKKLDSPLQITGNIGIDPDNNQMKDAGENPTVDHVQKTSVIGLRVNKSPKSSAERSREFRARRALLKQLRKQQQEADAIAESASEGNQVAVTSEMRIIEKRAKSAEATRRWRERKRVLSGATKKQAKTAAERMREYRARKKIKPPVLQQASYTQYLETCEGGDTAHEPLHKHMVKAEPKQNDTLKIARETISSGNWNSQNKDTDSKHLNVPTTSNSVVIKTEIVEPVTELFVSKPVKSETDCANDNNDSDIQCVDSAVNSLHTHLEKHDLNKYFICEICQYKCKCKRKLVLHMRVHNGEKPFACSICGYKYSEGGSLTKHMRIYTGEKLFTCDLCHYKFSEKYKLYMHMRTHTGEKPFACSLCEYKCSLKSNLTIHMRTHTGEKPFKCSICNSKFTQNISLITHMRTHTGEKPFTCTLCDYKGNRSDHLKNHMRSHTGEKSFICGICNYKCSRSSKLNDHMRTHTGEKPYTCNLCDYKCSVKYNLTIHMRTHT